MPKCALCRCRTQGLTKQLCTDCHIFKELMQKYGKDALIDQLPMITTGLQQREAALVQDYTTSSPYGGRGGATEDDDAVRSIQRQKSIKATRMALGMKEPTLDDPPSPMGSPEIRRARAMSDPGASPPGHGIGSCQQTAQQTPSRLREFDSDSSINAALPEMESISESPLPPARKRSKNPNRLSAALPDDFVAADAVPAKGTSSTETKSVPDDCIFVAAHSFKAAQPIQLGFKKKSLIRVRSKPDGGWWEGELLNSQGKVVGSGWFPAEYVKPPNMATKTASKSKLATKKRSSANSVSSISSAMSVSSASSFETCVGAAARQEAEAAAAIAAAEAAIPAVDTALVPSSPRPAINNSISSGVNVIQESAITSIAMTPEERKLEDDTEAFEREWQKFEEIRQDKEEAVKRELQKKNACEPETADESSTLDAITDPATLPDTTPPSSDLATSDNSCEPSCGIIVRSTFRPRRSSSQADDRCTDKDNALVNLASARTAPPPPPAKSNQSNDTSVENLNTASSTAPGRQTTIDEPTYAVARAITSVPVTDLTDTPLLNASSVELSVADDLPTDLLSTDAVTADVCCSDQVALSTSQSLSRASSPAEHEMIAESPPHTSSPSASTSPVSPGHTEIAMHAAVPDLPVAPSVPQVEAQSDDEDQAPPPPPVMSPPPPPPSGGPPDSPDEKPKTWFDQHFPMSESLSDHSPSISTPAIAAAVAQAKEAADQQVLAAANSRRDREVELYAKAQAAEKARRAARAKLRAAAKAKQEKALSQLKSLPVLGSPNATNIATSSSARKELTPHAVDKENAGTEYVEVVGE